MDLLANKYFLQFAVPLIAIILSVFLRFVTRSDFHAPFRKEDLAVGFDLAITALLLLVTSSAALAKELLRDPTNQVYFNKSISIPWLILSYVLGIWAVSTLVRKYGWEGDGRLKPFWGICAPGVFGLILLLITVNWIEQ